MRKFGDNGRWDWGMMDLRYWLFLALTLLLTGFIGYGTYSTARLLRTWQPDTNLLLMPAEAFMRLVFILVCIGLGLLSGLPMEQLGWSLTDAGGQIVWGIGWGIVMAGVMVLTTQWLLVETGQRFYSNTVLAHVLPKNRREVLLVAMAMISVVALEELLFRSLLLGGLTPLLSPSILIVLTAALFGLMHSPQGLWGMTGATLAGIILGILFFQAGSILLPVVSHYVANMAQIYLAMKRPTTMKS
jgi:membrane protease YdiL (CAAX protease family)